jgi:ribonuclease VapC
VAGFVELPTVLESLICPDASRQSDAFLRRAEITVERTTVEQAHIARRAFMNFGKGRHSAGLIFGDYFAYAIAKATGDTLLFKGEDFSKTDIRPPA